MQLFVTFKSDQDPDSDPVLDPHWFGSLTETHEEPQHRRKCFLDPRKRKVREAFLIPLVTK
jgi:hypothetical protein